jgi:hypothetical protein
MDGSAFTFCLQQKPSRMIELKSTGASAGTISSPALNARISDTDLINRSCSPSGRGSGHANLSRKRCMPHKPGALLHREVAQCSVGIDTARPGASCYPANLAQSFKSARNTSQAEPIRHKVFP